MPVIEMVIDNPVVVAAKRQRGLSSPCWRYQRATTIKNGNATWMKDEDPVVLRLAQYLSVHSKATELEREAIADAFPIESWAYEIYMQLYAGYRFHIEALVLGGMDSDEIADQFALPSDVVRFYELAFFDMRPHLSHTTAIKASLTSRMLSMKITGYDPDIAWKMLAISSGCEAVMALWDGGKMDNKTLREFDAIIAANHRRLAHQVQYSRGTSGESAPEVIAEYMGQRVHEANLDKLKSDETANTAVQQLATSIITAVPFSVAVREPMEQDLCAEFVSVAEDSVTLLSRLRGRKDKDNTNGKA